MKKKSAETKTETKEKVTAKKKAKAEGVNESQISMECAYDIIKTPLITEKSTLMTQNRQFAFEVCSKATKKEIKQAVEKIFKVKVDSVNTLNQKGKLKSFKGRIGRRSDRKKAYVCLAEGHTIDIGATL
jgi:large subunit ribosomal protein L23